MGKQMLAWYVAATVIVHGSRENVGVLVSAASKGQATKLARRHLRHEAGEDVAVESETCPLVIGTAVVVRRFGKHREAHRG